MTHSRRAGPIGRAARLALGICLVIIALPVWLTAGSAYSLSSLALLLVLVATYTLLHVAFSRIPGLNRALGSVIAAVPVFLVWLLGQGGGLLFGQGEGGTAALTFLAVSFLVDFARAGSGCEVMALPSLLVRRGTRLPCLLLWPIDRMEASAKGGADTRDGR